MYRGKQPTHKRITNIIGVIFLVMVLELMALWMFIFLTSDNYIH